MLIDTHCHLDFKDFDKDRGDVIDRAKSAGVTAIINVGSSVEGTRRSLELAKAHDIVYATLGVHPHEASAVTDKVIADFRALSKEDKVVAIGEVGLDYYQPSLRGHVVPEAISKTGIASDASHPRNDAPSKDEQATAFKKFIHLARDLNLPLIIHSREAQQDALDILAKENKNGVNAVMHCFAGDGDFLKRCLDLGLYISFTGNLTFKNASPLRDAAKAVPVEKLLLETDAPFLAPQKHRGKRNEPSFITELVDEWSALLGLSKTDIARITTHNANTLFKLYPAEQSKIAYEIRDSLYLNITNRCTNNCNFCVRNETNFVKGHNLMLEKEPSAEEILKAIGDPKRYKEIVFCGYGEPTMRLDIIKAVAKEVHTKGGKIRLVTNGHGDLINSKPIVKELAGLVDRVSVSLNAETKEKYDAICKPKFGPKAYSHVLDFIKDCAANSIETEVTCLDLENVDLKKCEEIAKGFGARFRLRSMGIVG